MPFENSVLPGPGDIFQIELLKAGRSTACTSLIRCIVLLPVPAVYDEGREKKHDIET